MSEKERGRAGGKHRAGLPGDISKRELFELFAWTERINDIYLSRKMRNGMVYLFAFIRYTTKGDALKAIAEMNRMRLRGSEILVVDAKYRRDDSKEWRVTDAVLTARGIQQQPSGVKADGRRGAEEITRPEDREHGKGMTCLGTLTPTFEEGPVGGGVGAGGTSSAG
ncbi:serine/arginine-rich SC35-like splicing factor SCL30 [Arachis stenosperma]|uniref:serine/arginine-rich SC35-like splicing factor SCL30 n=1 Tax=Arachis stenosperma TaxID=217475 RepID=UPI0025ABBD26|nr:serine/arginine-rich SC35-like splicing factor SCL30 [Arachis stenosperma]